MYIFKQWIEILKWKTNEFKHANADTTSKANSAILKNQDDIGKSIEHLRWTTRWPIYCLLASFHLYKMTAQTYFRNQKMLSLLYSKVEFHLSEESLQWVRLSVIVDPLHDGAWNNTCPSPLTPPTQVTKGWLFAIHQTHCIPMLNAKKFNKLKTEILYRTRDLVPTSISKWKSLRFLFKHINLFFNKAKPRRIQNVLL